jgi:hypothetical protein
MNQRGVGVFAGGTDATPAKGAEYNVGGGSAIATRQRAWARCWSAVVLSEPAATMSIYFGSPSTRKTMAHSDSISAWVLPSSRYEEDYYHPGEPRLVMELDFNPQNRVKMTLAF